jgi:hypothetical protein
LVAGQRPHWSPELEFCALSDGDGSRIGSQPNSADPLIAVSFALALQSKRAKPLVDLRLADSPWSESPCICSNRRFWERSICNRQVWMKTVFEWSRLVPAVHLFFDSFVGGIGFGLEISGFNLWNVLTCLQGEILFVFAATSMQTMIPEHGNTRTACSKKGSGLSHADRLFSH